MRHLAERQFGDKYEPMNPLSIALLAIVVALAGCSSGPISASNHTSATCDDLNQAIGGNSKEITSTAVNRGKVDNLSLPPWIPGGEKARSVIKNRQTAKIERLQAEQSGMRASRAQRCS